MRTTERKVELVIPYGVSDEAILRAASILLARIDGGREAVEHIAHEAADLMPDQCEHCAVIQRLLDAMPDTEDDET